MTTRKLRVILCLLALTVGGIALLRGLALPFDEHKMHYPQLPNVQEGIGFGVRASVNAIGAPCYLADDWQCTESGAVTNLHFWGSWLDGAAVQIDTFEVAIAEKSGWGGIGAILWHRFFPISEVTVTGPLPSAGTLGWYAPPTVFSALHHNGGYWEYEIDDIADPFEQTEGEEYWLIISAHLILNPNWTVAWGWQNTEVEHFGSPAMFSPQLDGGWELIPAPPGFGEPVNLAFVITGEEDGKPCCIHVDKKVSADGGDTWEDHVALDATGEVRYLIVVTNGCEQVLSDIEIKDHTHICIAYIGGSHPLSSSSTPVDNIWHLSNPLLPGESVEITYTALSSCPGTGNTYYNTAYVQAECADGSIVTAHDSASIVGLPTTTLYWGDRNVATIHRCDVADCAGTVEDIVTAAMGLASVVGVAVDDLSGTLYWADENLSSIQRCDMGDCAGTLETLITGNIDPHDIELDTAAGKMYFADSVFGICRANLDGSNIELLVPTGVLDGIALDLPAGKIYWVEPANGMLRRAGLDGSNVEDIPVPNVSLPSGIALHAPSSLLFWTDVGTLMVRGCVIGNCAGTVHGFLSPDAPSRLALDVFNNKVYWSANGKIYRATIGGSGVEVFIDWADMPTDVEIVQ